jgi:hypothetical protein
LLVLLFELPNVFDPPLFVGEFDAPEVALCPKLLADCDPIPLPGAPPVIPPPVTFTPLFSISIRGSYQNSQAS